MNILNKLARNSFNTLSRRHFHVIPVPALKDNYMYLVICDKVGKALAIDPVEPDKLMKVLEEANVQLKAVLTTHHHTDHAGGNSEMARRIPDIPIIGGDSRIDNMTQKIKHNEHLNISPFHINCLFTPCHTNGHFCYYIQSGNDSTACFSGDTLFVGGCGRFFEGTPKDMVNALHTLSALPDSTPIYCGHEYTVSNLKFAAQVEPSNERLKAKLSWSIERCSKQLPTVPSTIGDEKSYNPFLRLNELPVKKFCNSKDPVETMAILRSLKDAFKAV